MSLQFSDISILVFYFILKAPYLDLLKRTRHHGDEHVDEYDDGHDVVHHEQDLTHSLREGLHRPLPHRAQWHEAEQGPEQRQVAVPYPAKCSAKGVRPNI